MTPAFEEPSVRETLQVKGEIPNLERAGEPDRACSTGSSRPGLRVGYARRESTLRFFIVDGIHRASPAYEIISGDTLVRGCRLIKSPAELALMQLANTVTLERCAWSTHGCNEA